LRRDQGSPPWHQEVVKSAVGRRAARLAGQVLMLRLPKRLLVGRPMRSDRLDDTLLPKTLALPVFCSDPLSSNAYATEEILLALGLAGTALLHLTWAVAAAVGLLLAVVVASYRQTCRAYPTGGGAYAVSRANLGPDAALVAASALLIDYVLTVAVSVAAGVANIVSAVPALAGHAVAISLAMIALLTMVNLRGTKESGILFAVPTYGFVLVVLTMIGWGAARMLGGYVPRAESAGFVIEPAQHAGGLVAVALLLRAFSQGCTALTGVEAVSNGVPNFKAPKGANAAATLAIMGGLTIAMFAGITTLAVASDVRVVPGGELDRLAGAPAGYTQKTAIAQVGEAVFGAHSVLFYLVPTFTAAILILAANTAYNGFPILASLLSADDYLPRQFSRRGDRLVFSNGILVLAVLAGTLIWAFDADVSKLIQLYIIGVFVSFTLSQAGMVRHWTDQLRRARPGRRGSVRRSRAINAVGAALTAVVLIVVLISKFRHGAWIVVIAMPVVFAAMKAIKRHYRRVDQLIAPEPGGVILPARVHAIVLVSRLHKPAMRAIAYARATRPDTLVALTVATSPVLVADLLTDWTAREIPVKLVALESPYRDVTGPVLDYVAHLRRAAPRDLVVVFVPEYVVRRWWEHLLHNQGALRLKARLLFAKGVMTTNVPWQVPDRPEPDRPPPVERVLAPD
jgi:amino acid transporter